MLNMKVLIEDAVQALVDNAEGYVINVSAKTKEVVGIRS